MYKYILLRILLCMLFVCIMCISLSICEHNTSEAIYLLLEAQERKFISFEDTFIHTQFNHPFCNILYITFGDVLLWREGAF